MIDGSFTRDELEAAAAAASCMTEFLDAIGVVDNASSRKRMSERLRRAGIDRSHWTYSAGRRYTTEQLAEAVRASTSFAGVLRHLGCRQAGGTQHYLARRIRAEGLDIGHFTGQAHNRGRRAPRLSADDILSVLPPGSRRRKAPQLRRALLEKGIPDCCDECGSPPAWRGRRLVLVVEHRSGDWLDNRLANLRLLCPNCHSQTATWCRRKGS